MEKKKRKNESDSSRLKQPKLSFFNPKVSNTADNVNVNLGSIPAEKALGRFTLFSIISLRVNF